VGPRRGTGVPVGVQICGAREGLTWGDRGGPRGFRRWVGVGSQEVTRGEERRCASVAQGVPKGGGLGCLPGVAQGSIGGTQGGPRGVPGVPRGFPIGDFSWGLPVGPVGRRGGPRGLSRGGLKLVSRVSPRGIPGVSTGGLPGGPGEPRGPNVWCSGCGAPRAVLRSWSQMRGLVGGSRWLGPDWSRVGTWGAQGVLKGVAVGLCPKGAAVGAQGLGQGCPSRDPGAA
jgi:hypothetical protein